MKNEKYKAIAQSLKFKYIVLIIELHLSYLVCKIEARSKNPVFRIIKNYVNIFFVNLLHILLISDYWLLNS